MYWMCFIRGHQDLQAPQDLQDPKDLQGSQAHR